LQFCCSVIIRKLARLDGYCASKDTRRHTG
jgi:hypothetical protein